MQTPNKTDLKSNKDIFTSAEKKDMYRFPRNTHNVSQGMYASVDWSISEKCSCELDFTLDHTKSSVSSFI